MNQTRTIRLPVHVLKEINIYQRAAKALAQKLDHDPNAEEIANMVDAPINEVQRLLDLDDRVASMDAPLDADPDRTLLDSIADERAEDPADALQQEKVNAHLENWLGLLTEKQREVVERRFGLRGRDVSTLEQVGVDVGVTRERVRQIQVEALQRLRTMLEAKGYSLEALF